MRSNSRNIALDIAALNGQLAAAGEFWDRAASARHHSGDIEGAERADSFGNSISELLLDMTENTLSEMRATEAA